MKAILSALWLLLCLNAWGQNDTKNNKAQGIISGIIITGDNNQPIEGAVVILKNLKDTANSRFSSSDKSGAFKFSNVQNGSYFIRIKHIGCQEYSTGQLLIDNDHLSISLAAIKLNITNNNLNEVIITAAPKAYTEQKIDRTIVNVSQLLSNTGVSAAEVLNNAPGVEVTDDGISLRGKEGVTIYIDGHQTFLDGSELINYLKSLPSGSIEKLELMPVPPAKYHVSGNAGIINIITKKNHKSGFNGSVAVSHGQGQYAKSNYSLNLNYKTDKVNFFGDVSYASNNNYYEVQRQRAFHFADPAENYTINENNFETNNQKSTHYKFGLDADPDPNNSIGFMADGLISPYKENGNYLLLFNHVSPDSVVKTHSALNRHTSDGALNVYYQHKFKKEGENIRVDADYFNYRDDAVQVLTSNTYLPNGNTPIGSYNLITENPFKANVYSLKADYETKTFSSIKLSAGAQTIYSKRSSTGFYFNSPGVPNDSLTNSNTYSEHINAAYISLNKSFNRFTLDAGLRFENSSSYITQFNYAGIPAQPVQLTYNDLFPKFYASYKLDTAAINTLNFSFDSHIDRPDYSSLNPFAFYFDRYTVFQGNPNLQPERTTTFDLSFTHANIITLGTTLSKGNNTIIQYYYVSGQSLVKTSFNIHSTSDFGIYATATLPVFKWWTINLFNELSNLTFNGMVANNELLNNKVVTYRASGNNQFKFNNGWSAELSGIYRTKTSYGQGYYLPAWRMNASLQKKVLNGKGTITLSGADLFHSWKIRRDISVDNAEINLTNSNDTQQANLTFTYRFGSAGKLRSNKSGMETERNRAGVN